MSIMAVSLSQNSCQFCCYKCQSWRDLMRHTFESHSNEPNFKFACNIMFSNFHEVLLHHFTFISISEGQGHEILTDTGPVQGEPLPDIQAADNIMGDSELACTNICHFSYHDKLQRSAALFLLTLKEKYKLTQTALNFAVGQVQCMVNFALEDLKESMQLSDDESVLNFDPFEDLKSEHMQTKFFKENFGLVEPTTVVLNSYIGPGPRGTMVECRDTFQYVPLFDGLNTLLKNQDILDEIFKPHMRNDGLIGDFCDGSLFKSHPLYQHFPDALQIIAYFDEVEVCDPLASHSGVHKLGLFYYTLGNLRPELRSTHRSIQLVACITTPNLKKYGFQDVLQPFVNDVNTLANSGIKIVHNKQEITLRGNLLVVLADTLAAHDLGGFKVGVGFALRKCRFREEEFTMRTPATHDYYCSMLDTPLGPYDSVTYGINKASPLNNFENFHVADGQLPQDIMHVIFEGVLPLNIRLMLSRFVREDRFFTLDTLNGRIASFPYGRYEAKNKPPKQLDMKHLKGITKLPF